MMMQRTIMALFWGLMILWLLQSDGVAKASVKSESPTALWPTGAIKGYSHSVDQAKLDALREAAKRVKAFLEAQDPPITYWQPSPEYVADHLLKGKGQAGPDFPEPDTQTIWKTWEVTLVAPRIEQFRKLNRQAFQEFEKKERATRALARLRLIGEVLIGLVVLLTSVAAYICLDDRMGHAYSRWLQAATAGIVIATGLSLWFLH